MSPDTSSEFGSSSSNSLDTVLFNKDVRVYEYDANNPPFNKFADLQTYSSIIANENLKYTLKPESVTYFTTDYLTKNKTVYAKDVVCENGVVSWSGVEDKNHCYYRVYTSNDKDFIPSIENQIASTVATSISGKIVKKYVKVISVDKSGNAWG